MATPAAVLQIAVEAQTRTAAADLTTFNRKYLTPLDKAAPSIKPLADTRSATASMTKLTKKLDVFDRSSATATTRTSSLGSASKTASGHLAGAAKAAGAAALAYLSISQAKDAIATTEDLAKTTSGLNRNLGFTIKKASEWGAVAKSRDVDPKALTLSFTTLSRRLVDTAHALHEGGGAAETAMVPFTRLGLSQKDVVKGSKDVANFLPTLADAFGDAAGGADRQASAQQLLGKGYTTILPLFSSGAEGLKEQQQWADKYGATLTNKTVKGQMDLVSAQRESKVAMLGLKVTFAQALTPALEKANQEFNHIAAIMADDKLSNSEKFQKIGDIIGKWADKALDAFTKVLPAIVSRAGAAAPKIAGAIIQGFLDAPVWGKLVIGTFLLKKFGGMGAVTALGSRMGLGFGTSFAASAAPEIEGLSVVAGGEAAAGAGLAATAGIGPAAAGMLAVFGLSQIHGSIDDVAEFNDQIKETVRLASEGKKAHGLADQLESLAQGYKHVDEAQQSMNEHASTVAGKGGIGPLAASAKAATQDATSQFDKFKSSLVKNSGSVVNALHDMSKNSRSSFIDFLRAAHDAGDVGDKEFSRLWHAAENADAQFKTHMKSIARVTGESWKEVARVTEGYSVKASQNVKGFVDVVSGNVHILTDNVGKAMKAMGLGQEIKWTAEQAKGTPLAHAQQRGGPAGSGPLVPFAGGGVMVPGTGTGDKIPAMLEPGEVVLNRRAVAAMGGANKADAINSMIPRFATGGVVPGATSGLHPTILNFVSSLYSKFGGSVSSGLRPGTLHATGQAADYVPTDWAGAARAVNAAGPSLLEGIYNGAQGGPPVSWDTGSQVPPSFWGAATWADHWDHIHIAIADGAKVAAAKAIKEIKRVMLEGPDGPLKDMGQAALDKVRSAANAFIAKHAPSQVGMGSEGGTPGAPIKSLPNSLAKFNQTYAAHVAPDYGGYQMPVPMIVQLANWAGLPGDTFARIAHGESNYRPGAIGVDKGGTKGYGLWQITTRYSDADVMAATGGTNYAQMLNPVLNAIATKHKYDAAGGLSPWQGTQYLAKGGLVRGSGSGDTVPAMLEPGEMVINKKLVAHFSKGGKPKGHYPSVNPVWWNTVGQGLTASGKPPTYTPGTSKYTPGPSAQTAFDTQLALLDIAASDAALTGGVQDDAAVLDQRGTLIQSQITKVSNQLAKKGLNPKKRLALLQQLASLKGDLSSIADQQHSLYPQDTSWIGTETSTDTTAADQAAAQEAAQQALTEALKALTDEIAKQNALVNGALASDYTQALAYIGDLLGGAIGGQVAPRLSTAGSGSVWRS